MAVLNDDFTSDIRLAALNTGRMALRAGCSMPLNSLRSFSCLTKVSVTFAEVFRHDSDDIDLG